MSWANPKRRYILTSSPIGCAHIQNDLYGYADWTGLRQGIPTLDNKPKWVVLNVYDQWPTPITISLRHGIQSLWQFPFPLVYSVAK